MFGKVLRHDIRNGWLYRAWSFLVEAVILWFFCGEYAQYVEGWRLEHVEIQTNGSILNLLLFLFRGMWMYDPSLEDPFQFPTLWILLFLIPVVITMTYPTTDLTGNGSQVMLRTGGRGYWWFSKCVWVIFMGVWYYVTLCVTAVLFSLKHGFSLELKMDADLASLTLNGGMMPNWEMGDLFIILLLLPVLLIVFCGLVQLILSLWLDIAPGFAIVAGYLLLSSYFMSPLFLGNYTMILRSRWILEERGMAPEAGLILLTAGCLAAILIGYARFRCYDILPKEE